MKEKKVSATFWFLVGVFVLVASLFFIPAAGEFFKGPQFLLPFILFSALGGILIFFVMKEKIKGMLKKFLILTGASAAGFFVSVFLHNFLYAAAVLLNHISFLTSLFEILHGAFFFIAIFVCPIGFLIGVGGSIVLFIKRR